MVWKTVSMIRPVQKKTGFRCKREYQQLFFLKGVYVTFCLQTVRKEHLQGGYIMYGKESGEVRTQQMNYLDGLRRFRDKGVSVLVDGMECLEEEWSRIFETGEDGGFYMGDFICSEQGSLKEIRFDRVYLTDSGQTRR